MTVLNDFLRDSKYIIDNIAEEISIPSMDELMMISMDPDGGLVKVYYDFELHVMFMKNHYEHASDMLTLYDFGTHKNYQQRLPANKSKDMKLSVYNSAGVTIPTKISLGSEEGIFSAELVHDSSTEEALEVMQVISEVPDSTKGILTIRNKYNERLLIKCNVLLEQYIHGVLNANMV
ncbi:hypothetical protein EJP02_082 [Escherichia phage EJP2]|nr:hypothetical protein EJP02_082 [Escherichia phage EJP2]